MLAGTGVGLTAAAHAAVLVGIVPHTWVSGGRIADAATGRTVAGVSLLAVLVVAVIVLRAVGQGSRITRLERALLTLFGAGTLLSAPMQLAGTSFERFAMTPLAVILGLGALRLAAGRG